MNGKNTLGIFIEKRRMELGLTQNQLGEKVKTSRQTIYSWEKGNTIPNAEQLHELEFALKLSPGTLYLKLTTPNPTPPSLDPATALRADKPEAVNA